MDVIANALGFAERGALRACWIGITVAVAFGCGAPDDRLHDEAEVRAVVAEWRAAMMAGDRDRVMAVYSDDFSCADAPDRAAMRRWLDSLEDRGVLEGTEVFVDRAEIEWIDDGVRVFPVELAGPEIYCVTFRLSLRREDDGWRIVNQEW